MKKLKTTCRTVSMLFLIAFGAACPVNGDIQESYKLTVKPTRCIALHKGQVCYQKLKFRWKMLSSEDFCLYQESKDEPLACWSGNERSNFEYKFESSTSESFSIRRKDTDDSVAEVKVTLSWVYRTGRKNSSGWRLF